MKDFRSMLEDNHDCFGFAMLENLLEGKEDENLHQQKKDKWT